MTSSDGNAPVYSDDAGSLFSTEDCTLCKGVRFFLKPQYQCAYDLLGHPYPKNPKELDDEMWLAAAAALELPIEFVKPTVFLTRPHTITGFAPTTDGCVVNIKVQGEGSVTLVQEKK